jgi:hypothetical protein
MNGKQNIRATALAISSFYAYDSKKTYIYLTKAIIMCLDYAIFSYNNLTGSPKP